MSVAGVIARRRLLLASSLYDPASDALFAAMTVQPDSTRKALIDTCILALKSAGVWSALDVLQVYAAHDQQAGNLNWKNPAAFTASPVSSPTWTADVGYATNGTSSKVDTGYNPGTSAINFAQNSGCMFLWDTNNIAVGNHAMGFSDGSKGCLLNPRSNANKMSGRINSTSSATTASITTVAGSGAISRVSSSQVSYYKNGAAFDSPISSTSTTIASGNISIGAYDATSFRAVNARLAFVSSGLNGTQISDAHNAFDAYLAGL